MAVKPKRQRQAAKAKQAAAGETSQTIEEQTAAFFKSGGKVDYIKTGISGQQGLAGPRHISLGNKPRT